MALMLVQCMAVSALAASGAGFSDVAVDADVEAQEITVTGTVPSGSEKQLTVTLKRGDDVRYLNQFTSSADGTFTLVIPTTFSGGQTFTLVLGGASEQALETSFTVPGGSSGGGGSGSTRYTITAKAGIGGTITPTQKVVTRKRDANFIIKASDGYQIKDVLVDGKSVGAVGTYTFEKVTRNHTIEAQFEPVGSGAPWTNPFTDVAENSWYYPAVRFVNDNGLFSGTSATTFAPDMVMTRGMLVTVLHRWAGAPEREKSDFTDVTAGSWYAAAVDWAAAEGVVNGVGSGRFDPDGSVTREQIATILYRYAQKTNSSLTAKGELGQFKDAASVSSFAADGMKWAVGNGLISGKDGGILDPVGNATRAEVATIMMRFAEKNA